MIFRAENRLLPAERAPADGHAARHFETQPSLLDDILRATPRRYRVPTVPDASTQARQTAPSALLAVAIEQTRVALAGGNAPDDGVKHRFIEALAGLIKKAMRIDNGDPVFQAMVLQHQAAQIREYASLSEHANEDRRAVRSIINAFAHPAKLLKISPSEQADALAQLHALANDQAWRTLRAAARGLYAALSTSGESALLHNLTRLLESPALANLCRLKALESDELVLQYLSLLSRQGPNAGSADAMNLGSVSKERGSAVEKLATQALEALARRLNEDVSGNSEQIHFRVVTSMRTPPTIPGEPARAKTEWDVVLLKQAPAPTEAPWDAAQLSWDICLLVEAKASPDAATTDFPRLLRGLRLLAHAEKSTTYRFETQQGTVLLRGATFSRLSPDEVDVAKLVLYCCDAPADEAPRLLSAASRMQLLSAEASVEFADQLSKDQPAAAETLEVVWHQLLTAPEWKAVLNQYATMYQARELMVHLEDLRAAIEGG